METLTGFYDWLGATGQHWLPLVYQYAIGLVLILLGTWAGFKTGVWSKSNWRWLGGVWFGWFVFMTIQTTLQFMGAG